MRVRVRVCSRALNAPFGALFHTCFNSQLDLARRTSHLAPRTSLARVAPPTSHLVLMHRHTSKLEPRTRTVYFQNCTQSSATAMSLPSLFTATSTRKEIAQQCISFRDFLDTQQRLRREYSTIKLDADCLYSSFKSFCSTKRRTSRKHGCEEDCSYETQWPVL